MTGVEAVPQRTGSPAAPAGTAVLIGNPRPGSRTAVVARQVTAVLHAALRARGIELGEPGVVDVSQLGADLGWGTTAPAVARAGALIRRSRLLLVASPTFKGTYTGVLKVFLDQLPRRALAGVVAVPVMTAASPAHTFAADQHLRPVLVELGATVPVPGLTVLEADFGAPGPVLRWATAVAPVLSAVLCAARHEKDHDDGPA